MTVSDRTPHKVKIAEALEMCLSSENAQILEGLGIRPPVTDEEFILSIADPTDDNAVLLETVYPRMLAEAELVERLHAIAESMIPLMERAARVGRVRQNYLTEGISSARTLLAHGLFSESKYLARKIHRGDEMTLCAVEEFQEKWPDSICKPKCDWFDEQSLIQHN